MWNLAGAVILSGLVIVFLILCILILVVDVTGRLAGKPSKKKTPAAASTAAPAKQTPKPAAPPPPVVQEGISGETVAVISAAVAAMMADEAPHVDYAISAIQQQGAAAVQRDRASRPVWGFAGMLQNTRPF